jgi:hypothetical protein
MVVMRKQVLMHRLLGFQRQREFFSKCFPQSTNGHFMIELLNGELAGAIQSAW